MYGYSRLLPGARRTFLLSVLLALSAASAGAAEGWLDKIKDVVKERQNDTAEGDEALSQDELGRGLKEALRVGTSRVVGQLGAEGGFNLDPQVHIPLPDQLEQVKQLLAKVGMEGAMTDLETRLNRAAEIATPRAEALFLQAINDMTLEDVTAIYNGPDDAATRYFESRMAEPLSAEMKPVVDESLADAGAVQAYDAVMERYRQIPFAPQVEADLGDYVVDRGSDGIFYYLAREEAAIRADPAKRTTDLLKRVFGR